MNQKFDLTNQPKKQPYFTRENVQIKIELRFKSGTFKTQEDFNFIIEDCTLSLAKPITVDSFASLLAIEFTNIKQLTQEKRNLTLDESDNATSKIKINLCFTDFKEKVSYPLITCTLSSPFYLRYCDTNLFDGACFILISKTKSYNKQILPDLEMNQSKSKNSLINPDTQSWVLEFAVDHIPSQILVIILFILAYFSSWSYRSTSSLPIPLYLSGSVTSCVLPSREPYLPPRYIAQQNLYSIAEVMRREDPLNWKRKMDTMLDNDAVELTQDYGSKFVPKMRRSFNEIYILDQKFDQQNQPFQLTNAQNLALTSPVPKSQINESTHNIVNPKEIIPQLPNVSSAGPVADGRLSSRNFSQFHFSKQSSGTLASSSNQPKPMFRNTREVYIFNNPRLSPKPVIFARSIRPIKVYNLVQNQSLSIESQMKYGAEAYKAGSKNASDWERQSNGSVKVENAIIHFAYGPHHNPANFTGDQFGDLPIGKATISWETILDKKRRPLFVFTIEKSTLLKSDALERIRKEFAYDKRGSNILPKYVAFVVQDTQGNRTFSPYSRVSAYKEQIYVAPKQSHLRSSKSDSVIKFYVRRTESTQKQAARDAEWNKRVSKPLSAVGKALVGLQQNSVFWILDRVNTYNDVIRDLPDVTVASVNAKEYFTSLKRTESNSHLGEIKDATDNVSVASTSK